MESSFSKLLNGHKKFREKYAKGDSSVMRSLSCDGQSPETMVIACSDSRVDPALILQSDPGDLFVVRNVANIVPPYELDDKHHGTSAALEFGICFLKVKHLILLGHNQCAGIEAMLDENYLKEKNDFITNWVSIVKSDSCSQKKDLEYANSCLQNNFVENGSFCAQRKLARQEDFSLSKQSSFDEHEKIALQKSYENCLTFPWIKEKVENGKLKIHLWFFDIKTGTVSFFCDKTMTYQPLESYLSKN